MQLTVVSPLLCWTQAELCISNRCPLIYYAALPHSGRIVERYRPSVCLLHRGRKS